MRRGLQSSAMSIFADIFEDILSLVLPRTCIVCGELLQESKSPVCVVCSMRVPLTNFSFEKENAMVNHLRGIIPIESATSLFWYVHNSDWRALIHRFKYSGNWFTARKMGEWLGTEMVRGGCFEDIELIIPVPLHPIRRLQRGYNQSEQIAVGVARKMNVEYDFGVLRRKRNNKSQTQQDKFDRVSNVQGLFEVRHPERLRGKHILIVDDVFTTGATISACASAIIKACNHDVRISVATLASAQHILNKQ